MYTITSEYYPTLFRNSITAFAIAFGRCGSILSPYIQLAGEVYWKNLPFAVFGTAGLLSGVLFAIFIPETKNRKLPETLDEFKD